MTQQTCKVCGRPDKFDFHVPDETWDAAVPPEFRNRVICLFCFDDLAEKAGVEYASTLRTLYFAGRRAVFEFETKIAVSC